MTRKPSPPAAPLGLLVALLLTSAAGAPKAPAQIDPDSACTSRVRIGVYAETRVDPQSPEPFAALEEFLDSELAKRSPGFCVDLQPGSHDANVQSLHRQRPDPNHDDQLLDGALMPAFRYVALAVEHPDVEVLAQIRQPSGAPPAGPRELPAPAVDEYVSVVVMRRESGNWEPPSGARRRFTFLSTRSTSGYVFPMAHFRERGLLDEQDRLDIIPAIPLDGKNPGDPWDLDAHAGGQVKIRDLLMDLTRDHGQFDLVGTTLDQIRRELSEEQRRKLVEVYRSPPIPLDPLIVRKVGVLTDGAKRDALRAAFLATATLTESERDVLFVPRANPVGSYKERSPDIYDFVPATAGTYDPVRRAGVLADGGVVFRLGLTAPENPDWEQPRARLLGDAARALLQAPQGRVYLELRWYGPAEVGALLHDLDAGRLDGAELAAHHASRALANGHGPLLQLASRSQGATSTSHSVVALRIKRAPLPDEPRRIAFPGADSSSGYWFPFEHLTEAGERPSSKQILQAHDHFGVASALTNAAGNAGSAEFRAQRGFVPAWHWASLKQSLSPEQRARIAEDDSIEVPNPVVLISRRFCDCFQDQKLGAAGTGQGAWSSQLVRRLVEPASRASESAASAAARQAVLERLSIVFETLGAESEQLLYRRVDTELVARLERHREAVTPDVRLMSFAVFGLVLVGSAGMIVYAHLRRQRPAPLQLGSVNRGDLGEIVTRAHRSAAALRDNAGQLDSVLRASGGAVAVAGSIEAQVTAALRASARLDGPGGAERIDELKAEYYRAIAALRKTLEDDVKAPVARHQEALARVADPARPEPAPVASADGLIKSVTDVLDIVERVLALGKKLV